MAEDVSRLTGCGRGRGRGRPRVESAAANPNFGLVNDQVNYRMDTIDGYDEIGRNRRWAVAGNSEQRQIAFESPIDDDGRMDRVRTKDTYQQGQGSTSWAEHKNWEVPPFEYESSQEEEADQEFNEKFMREKLKPVMDRKILRQIKDGRHLLISSNKHLRLPIGYKLNTRLLCVDAKGVLYLRCEDSDQGSNTGSLTQLNLSMKDFYSQPKVMAEYGVGMHNWIPQYGEVVVVRVNRHYPNEAAPDVNILKPVYQRAVVREVKLDFIIVELIDSYGTGRVQLCDVFRIKHKYALLPPQMFKCDLEGMALIRSRKIQTVLRNCPIRNIWPDCEMNRVVTTWAGEFSKHQRPLVEVLIHTRDFSAVSLKDHVFRNFKTVRNTIVHLHDGSPEVKVLDVSPEGWLWVTFVADHPLRTRVHSVLRKLLPHYYLLRKHCFLTTYNICPEGEDEKDRRERNRSKLYVVALPVADMEPSYKGKEKYLLYRVSIHKVLHATNQVEVRCIDHHVLCTVMAYELIPLYNLYPDVSHIYPLVLKVHLYKIVKLDTENSEVKKLLAAEDLTMKLACDMISDKWPPEVSLFSKSHVESQEMVWTGKENPITGYAGYFVKKQWARAMDDKVLRVLNEKIRLETLKRDLESCFKNGFELTELENPSLQHLQSQTFMGTSFEFLQDPQSARCKDSAEVSPQSSQKTAATKKVEQTD